MVLGVLGDADGDGAWGDGGGLDGAAAFEGGTQGVGDQTQAGS